MLGNEMKVPEPDVPVRPVDRVRALQGEGPEEGLRAGLLPRVLQLERLPLQPPAGDERSRAVDAIDSIRGKFNAMLPQCKSVRD